MGKFVGSWEDSLTPQWLARPMAASAYFRAVSVPGCLP